MNAGRTIVRARLEDREDRTTIDLLQSSNVAPVAAALRLAEGLAKELGVAAGKLRPEDRLGDLFRVRRPEFTAISDKQWADSKLGGFFEVARYDIMFLVEHTSTRAGWTAQWRTLDPRPQNEDQWLDRIMQMRVDEFLRFFVRAAESAPPRATRAV